MMLERISYISGMIRITEDEIRKPQRITQISGMIKTATKLDAQCKSCKESHKLHCRTLQDDSPPQLDKR
jgi:hypothetical protein